MTMESSTAVADAPEVVAPLEVQPETSDQPSEESTAVETLVTPEIATPPDYNKLLADLPDDEFDRLDRVSRRQESVRRKTAAEEQAKLLLRDQEWLARDEYVADFRQAVQLVEDEITGTPKLNLDAKKFSETADRVFGTAQRLSMGVLGAEVQKVVPADFTLTSEDANRIAEARQAYLENPLNSGPLISEWLKTVKAVGARESEAEIEKRVEKRLRDETTAKQKTEEVRIADATRASETVPTQVSGVPGQAIRVTSMSDADRAYSDGQIDHRMYKQYREQFGLGAAPGGR